MVFVKGKGGGCFVMYVGHMKWHVHTHCTYNTHCTHTHTLCTHTHTLRAQQPPLPEPMLYLNGDGGGIINNMCFPSTVAPSYAPPGMLLLYSDTYDNNTIIIPVIIMR